MERVQLSKRAKAVLKSLRGGVVACPESMIQSDFNSGARELQSHGLAVCHEEENRNVEAVRLTDKGKLYLEDNPHLYNPIDWKWVVTTAIAVVAALAASEHADCHDASQHQRSNLLEFHNGFFLLMVYKR